MTRTVFYGFGAFVGALRGQSQCAWWDDDPVRYGWDPAALIPVDLARNPSAVRAGTLHVDDIEVDDHRIDGGLTTIGPLWPSGSTIGQCWLSEPYYTRLTRRPPRQPASSGGDAYDYESTSILYWDGELGGRRFYGFHANITQTAGSIALVQIWAGGTGRIPNRAPAGAWWLDLSAVAHPIDPIATQIAPGGPPTGALFLDSITTRSLMLPMTKRPLLSGQDDYPA